MLYDVPTHKKNTQFISVGDILGSLYAILGNEIFNILNFYIWKQK